MSGKRRVASYRGQKVCMMCHEPVHEWRPVFLVKTASGLVVGPYHAMCAAAVANTAREHGVQGAEAVQQRPLPPRPAREETLPW